MAERVTQAIDRWLAEGFLASDRDLALARIVFGLTALALVFPDWTWFLALPDSWYLPRTGPAALFGPPGEVVVHGLRLLLGAGLVAVTLGVRTRPASWVVAIVAMIGFSIEYGHRPAAHHLVFWIMPLLLAAVWGRAWSVDAGFGSPADDRPTGRPQVALLAVVTALVFFAAALVKVDGGWLDPGGQAVANNLHVRADGVLIAPTTWSWLRVTWVWELADLATIGLELAPLALLPWPRAFRRLVGVLAVFHLVILLVLGINFPDHLVVFLALLPVVSRWPFGRARAGAIGARTWTTGLAAATLAAATVPVLLGHGVLRWDGSFARGVDLAVHVGLAGVAVAVAWRLDRDRSSATPSLADVDVDG